MIRKYRKKLQARTKCGDLIRFFNVKKRTYVFLDEKKCKKTILFKNKTSKGTRICYRIQAIDNDRTILKKIAHKVVFDKLNDGPGPGKPTSL